MNMIVSFCLHLTVGDIRYIICVNKIDLWDEDSLAEWKDKLGIEYLFISAKEKLGLEDLKQSLADNRPPKDNDIVEQE